MEFDVEDLFPAIVDETATATVEPAMDTSNLVTHEPQPACATGDARDEIEQDLVVAGQSEAARVEDGATSYHDGAAGTQEHNPEEDHQGQGEGPGLAQTVQPVQGDGEGAGHDYAVGGCDGRETILKPPKNS